ncbi:hypothetical protein RIR_jg5056.t1 [Rhizophagus irregularis DAOM 181602=DAOM 197198]|nr:hypothetical protein RIR_jg5056.t1 [Rhizophagus irregularis DAOM 181602=DAOM 197198]
MAKLKGFKDMAKFHAENQTPDITRTTHRIDYIFGNNNILNASIHTFAQKIPPSHFTSDHKAVITLLQNDFSNALDIVKITFRHKMKLDHTWNIFEHSLHNIKKSTIPQKKITPQEHHHLYPLHIRQLNRHVITLYKTKQFLNLKHIYIRNKIEKPKTNLCLSRVFPDSMWTSYFKNWKIHRDHIQKNSTLNGSRHNIK